MHACMHACMHVYYVTGYKIIVFESSQRSVSRGNFGHSYGNGSFLSLVCTSGLIVITPGRDQLDKARQEPDRHG